MRHKTVLIRCNESLRFRLKIKSIKLVLATILLSPPCYLQSNRMFVWWEHLQCCGTVFERWLRVCSTQLATFSWVFSNRLSSSSVVNRLREISHRLSWNRQSGNHVSKLKTQSCKVWRKFEFLSEKSPVWRFELSPLLVSRSLLIKRS